MIALDYIEVNTQSQQICLASDRGVNCQKVSIGCVDTPTPKGTFKVGSIYLNPIPQHPITGNLYDKSKLGGFIIALEGTETAIHGWKDQDQIGSACSLGCVRVPQELLESLVFNYYFNQIIIK